MSLLRLLDFKAACALAAAMLLGGLLGHAWLDARKWHRSSDRFERLYRAEQSTRLAEAQAVRIASAQAAAADAVHARQVETLQNQISQRSDHDVQTRLADVRARYQRLHQGDRDAATAASRRTGAAVPGSGTSSHGAGQAADEAGLSGPDALIATEQAIQLDELIKWVRAQTALEREPRQP